MGHFLIIKIVKTISTLKKKGKGRRKNYVQNVASNEDFKGFQNTVQFPEQLRIAGQA